MTKWQNDMVKHMEKETEATRLGRVLQAKLFVVEQLHRFLKNFLKHMVTDGFELLFPGIKLNGDSDINHWHADQCEIRKKGFDITTLILKITIPKIDKTRRILKADPFTIFKVEPHKQNTPEEVCEYHYNGAIYVMYDTITECTRELDLHPITPTQTYQVYRPDQCTTLDLTKDPFWTKGKCYPNDHTLEWRIVQIKEDETDRFVYCWKQNLTTTYDEIACENVIYKSEKKQHFSINNNPSPIYNTDKVFSDIKLGASVTEIVNQKLFSKLLNMNVTIRKMEGLMMEDQAQIDTLLNRGIVVFNDINIWVIVLSITLICLVGIVGYYVYHKYREQQNNTNDTVHFRRAQGRRGSHEEEDEVQLRNRPGRVRFNIPRPISSLISISEKVDETDR